jgi:hypothetical protein
MPDKATAPLGAVSCTALSEANGEALIGTAFVESVLLLVEQPGSWGSEGLAASGFDSEVAGELKRRLQPAGVRVLAIRRVSRMPGEPRRWMIVRTDREHRSIRWGTFTADSELLDLRLDADADVGEPLAQPIYLVCTNGSRDACCAVRGRPVVSALSALRPGDVWECSHVGGHRYGANVLVLPIGDLYGRITPADAPSVVEAAEGGDTLMTSWRGRIGLTPFAQAGLAAVAASVSPTSWADLYVNEVSLQPDNRAVVRVAASVGEFVVTIEAKEQTTLLASCGKPEPSAYLAYQPIGIA